MIREIGLKKKAFTLNELMVAVIVIGILASLALPMFGRAIEATKAKEAVVALQQIRNAERIHRVEENTYWSPQTASQNTNAGINTKFSLDLDVRQERNWDYSITVTGATQNAFIATAKRKGGRYDGETIVFDQNGLNYSQSTWPANLLPKE